MPGAIMQPEKARNHPRLRLPLIAGLVLLLAVSCDSSHVNILDAANVGHDTAGSLSKLRLCPASGTRYFCAPNSAGVRLFARLHPFMGVWGSGNAPAGPKSGESTPTRFAGGFSFSQKLREPVMAKSFPRALSRLFPSAAYPVAHFPTESEAVLFARQYLAQTGRAVAVAPAVIGFDVIGGGV